MSTESTTLIVEDDPNVLLGCEQALQLEGLLTQGVASAEEAIQHIAPQWPGVVVSDIRLPGRDGMALLRQLQGMDADLPVILITGHGDVALAVEAMKAGAYDFLEKPFSSERLVEVVRRALEKRRLVLENRQLRDQLARRSSPRRLIGQSDGILRIQRLIADLAATSANILIQGETGTGKELVARCLHEAGPRGKGHFVAINCGGLPETLFDSEIFGHEAGAFTGATKRRIGKIEYAQGGTLFLDEIESMPMSMQVKLLRVLQERTLERLGGNQPIHVDCRVIAATKEDLRALAEAGKFRADLYYRLSVAHLPLPPLRERREDIPALFDHFLMLAAASFDRPLSPPPSDMLQRLMAYHWPGNVRELRNVADRHALGIEQEFASAHANAACPPPALARSMEAFERTLISQALAQAQGNASRAAQLLQVPKQTLHDRIKRLGIGGESA